MSGVNNSHAPHPRFTRLGNQSTLNFLLASPRPITTSNSSSTLGGESPLPFQYIYTSTFITFAAKSDCNLLFLTNKPRR